jgi:hypothetical protein
MEFENGKHRYGAFVRITKRISYGSTKKRTTGALQTMARQRVAQTVMPPPFWAPKQRQACAAFLFLREVAVGKGI